MAFNPLRKIIGDPNERALKQLQPVVEEINDLEFSIEALSDTELAAKTDEFRGRLADGETLDDVLPEALAVCREAIRRTVGERAYDVQLTGAIALHRGMIAEMRTGEGKTLVATLALYANALTGEG
ncbi:MAG: preprotein translocase subunit SecA, partial [Chloroflexi bacterium]|nr:preprotein translocase subunit SecA [Chloroflexota bacterium]